MGKVLVFLLHLPLQLLGVVLHIHVISFDIPYPPSYGGVIDVYWKIKNMQDAGIKVILHCFYDSRTPAPILASLCETVYYYPRKSYLLAFPFYIPYMVCSRRSTLLTQRISQDDFPIWIEGLQGCYHLRQWKKAFPNKKIAVRVHNIEWEYYSLLRKAETNILRKAYFFWESFLLHRFEKTLAAADSLWAISPADTEYLAARFPRVHYLPAFHPFKEVKSKKGIGTFALYHGNLEVAENHQAVCYLITEVFAHTNYPLIIAGSAPRQELILLVRQYPHISLEPTPSDAQLAYWIEEAHLHVLPTFQATGIKLKLLHALFCGRFVLANKEMVANTGTENAVILCKNPADFRAQIANLANTPFTEKDIENRKELLERSFHPRTSMEKLIKYLQ